MGRDFRIDRKDDEGEKEMNRADVNFGVERESSGKARRRKGKGEEKKWQVYQGEATVRDGDGGEEGKAGVGDGVEIFQGGNAWECRGRGKSDRWRGRRCRIRSDEEWRVRGREERGWTDGNGRGWRRWRWWCDDLAAAAAAAA